MKRDSRQSAARLLPSGFQLLFSLLALHALFFEFTPALSDYRLARSVRSQQTARQRSLRTRLARQDRMLDSLNFDLQTIEWALDEKWLLPPNLSAKQ
ncbi:MAG: hypothetical protein ACE5F1_14690 [Planctomycetota bacterium]